MPEQSTSPQPRDGQLLRAVILAFLFATPALVPILGNFPVRDPDIWWHLATGRWIVENVAVPHTDPFVGGADAVAWTAYSWLYEVFIYALYQLRGLDGFFVYTTLASVAVAGAVYHLVRGIERRFTVAVALTTFALMTIWGHLGSRSFVASIVLFAVELDVLVRVRRGADRRLLLVLPALFAVWANLHIQFVYGLLLLAIASAEAVFDRLMERRGGRRPAEAFDLSWIIGASAACALAVLATPYTWRLYAIIPELAGHPAMWRHISELQSPSFHSMPQWAFLALALGAAFALGRRRETRPFWLLLFASAALLAFRATRDTWVLSVAAIAMVAEAAPRRGLEHDTVEHTGDWRVAVVCSVTVLALVAGALGLRALRGPDLPRVAADAFPAGAASFVESADLVGTGGRRARLFNHMDWGGYLLWRLPACEVSMDGRIINFGDAALERSMATWAGLPGWDEDPALAGADIVIGAVGEPLIALLRGDERFEIAYEDEIAAVFVPAPKLAAVDRR